MTTQNYVFYNFQINIYTQIDKLSWFFAMTILKDKFDNSIIGLFSRAVIVSPFIYNELESTIMTPLDRKDPNTPQHVSSYQIVF